MKDNKHAQSVTGISHKLCAALIGLSLMATDFSSTEN